jgi:hypothetical protein
MSHEGEPSPELRNFEKNETSLRIFLKFRLLRQNIVRAPRCNWVGILDFRGLGRPGMTALYY